MDGLDFSSNKAKVRKHDSLPTVTTSDVISPRLKLTQSTSTSTVGTSKPASLDSYVLRTEKIHHNSEKKSMRLSDNNKEEKTPHEKEKTHLEREKTHLEKEKTHLEREKTHLEKEKPHEKEKNSS